jgi:hypothetical protein
VTNDFESDLRRRSSDRVAGMPDAYGAAPALLTRARRRRSAKLGALAATVVILGAGTAAAVTQVAGRQNRELTASAAKKSKAPRTLAPPTSRSLLPPQSTTPASVVSATTVAPSSTPPLVGPGQVATVACPINSARPTQPNPPPPSTAPRGITVGDPSLLATLSSFAATTDPTYEVLGPNTWSCDTILYNDGRSAVGVFDPAIAGAVPDIGTAPIAVDNDWLWHGGVGSVAACSVFDEPALVHRVTQYNSRYLPCPRAGRTVTPVDAHVATFVDADGARGAGRMVLPSAQGGDGSISVLTCRPTTGLTAAECDTIVADFVARLKASE